jgi:hypothetical protein
MASAITHNFDAETMPSACTVIMIVVFAIHTQEIKNSRFLHFLDPLFLASSWSRMRPMISENVSPNSPRDFSLWYTLASKDTVVLFAPD